MNKANKSEDVKAAPIYQNQVRLVGYIGNAPRQYDGRVVFSLATQASWKPADSDEWQHETDWHRVVAWKDLASAVSNLAKGDHVLVEGQLRSSRYEKEVAVRDGQAAVVPVKAWEIRARAVRKLIRKKKKKPATA